MNKVYCVRFTDYRGGRYTTQTENLCLTSSKDQAKEYFRDAFCLGCDFTIEVWENGQRNRGEGFWVISKAKDNDFSKYWVTSSETPDRHFIGDLTQYEFREFCLNFLNNW